MRTLPAGMLGLLFVAGCGVDANYTLQLVPRVPPNQSPFTDGPDVAVRLLDADGNEDWTSLGELSSGTLEDKGFAPLADTRVGIGLGTDGEDLSGLFAWGETAPLTAGNDKESLEVTVLVAREDGFGALTDLPIPSIGGALAMTSAGSVYVFGGISRTSGACTDSIYKLADIQAGAWTFRSVDFALPAAVCHASATLVEVDGEERIVIAGGEERTASEAFTTMSNAIAIFDPSTDEVEWTGTTNLYRARHHVAVLNDGRLLMVGASQRGNGAVSAPSWELFDPDVRRAGPFGNLPLENDPDVGGNVAVIGPWEFAAAPVDGGLAMCGGALWQGTDVITRDWCRKIAADGSVTALPDLPMPLRAAAMTRLADGTLLIAGGITANASAGPHTDAVDGAWTLEPGASSWESAGTLTTPRAYHRLVAGSGRSATVVGGVGAGWSFSQTTTDPRECAERWVDGSFTAHADCALAGTGFLPMVGVGRMGAVSVAGLGVAGSEGQAFGIISLGPQ